FLYFRYAHRYKYYWAQQNVVHEEFSLLLGPLRNVFTKACIRYTPVQFLDQELYKKYGRLFGTFVNGRPVLFVADPDLVKMIMARDFHVVSGRNVSGPFLTSFGDPVPDNMMTSVNLERWKPIRSVASPAFSSANVKKINGIITESARATSEYLRKNRQDFDVKKFFANYALNVISKCAFGVKLNPDSDVTNKFANDAKAAFGRNLLVPLAAINLFPDFIKWLNMSIFNVEIFRCFKNFATSVMKERDASGKRNDDFVQHMMDARGNLSSVRDAEHTQRKGRSITSYQSSKVLFLISETEAVSQCVLIFLAGMDSISSVISHTIYLLALHREEQRKLQEEVDECFKIHGEQPSADVISKLSYLHAVVSETFGRSSRVLDRSPTEDYVLGDTGITVPKGGTITIPIYSMHRDPLNFSNPDSFIPERFNDENISSICPYTYLPFGAGPKSCMGVNFALLSVNLCILHSIRNFEFSRTQKTKVPLKCSRGIGLLHTEEFSVGIRERFPTAT
ncbi:unnamed protein product, partial [Ixodes hexagonus]